MLLQAVELGVALDLCEVGRPEPVDQAMDRRRAEADVERCGARRRGNAHELFGVDARRQAAAGQAASQLREQRADRARFAGARGAQQQKAQRLGLATDARAVEEVLYVCEHDADEELLVVVV